MRSLNVIIMIAVMASLAAGPAAAGRKKAQARAAQAEQQRLRELAARGHVDSQYELGRRLHLGDGVQRDLREAFVWYGRAADAGDAIAMNNMAAMFRAGDGVPKDPGKALALYRQAAGLGSALAHYNVGLMLDGDPGVAPDAAKAASHFAIAAEEGDPDAMVRLAEMYRDGRGVAADRSRAWTWADLARIVSQDRQVKWRARGVLDGLHPGWHRSSRGLPGWVRSAQEDARRWIADWNEIDRLEEAATLASDRGRDEEAVSHLQAALRLAKSSGRPGAWISRITYNLGRLVGFAGHHDEARRLLERALVLEADESGPDGLLAAMRHAELARLNHDVGAHALAVPHFERSLAIARRLGAQVVEPHGFADQLEDQATSLAATGDAEQAAAARAEAADLRRGAGPRPRGAGYRRYR